MAISRRWGAYRVVKPFRLAGHDWAEGVILKGRKASLEPYVASGYLEKLPGYVRVGRCLCVISEGGGIIKWIPQPGESEVETGDTVPAEDLILTEDEGESMEAVI